MKIVCIYYDYPPFLLAGSEMGAHEINKYLVSKGHQVIVFTNTRGLREYEGIEMRDIDAGRIAIESKTADWIFSQFQWCPYAAEMAKRFNKQALLFFHTKTAYSSLNASTNVHICYNSQYMKEQINYRHPYVIVFPPVVESKVKAKKKEPKYVTLINCGRNKGGDFMIQLANQLPDVDFMGVEGGYSEQIMDLESENIQYVHKTNNMKLVYGQTKILIVPSAYESWGRVIHEAMINGIPVIATPNKGVMECGGDAVVYLDRLMLKPWINEITKLLNDSGYYQERAKKGLKRAKELNANTQFKHLENYLTENKAV